MFKFLPVALVATCFATSFARDANAQQLMTYDEARGRVDNRAVPVWWISDLPGLAKHLARIEKGKVTTIARSPGGRDVHLVSYGTREKGKPLANFNSAVGAHEPQVYRDKAAREKPVVYLVGPVHGHEIEGLVGLVNLIQVLESGRDLRGRRQPRLFNVAQRCRLLIVPTGNPDGIARCEPRSFVGMSFRDMRFWGQGTWSDDTLCGWPGAKRIHPMVGERVGFLGGYFNDIGINPMHDEFFAPLSTEAPAILKVAREEAPDIAVSLHSHNDLPTVIRPAHVPLEVQQDVLSVAERCYTILDERGLPHVAPFAVQAEQGEYPRSFNLVSAIYHTSGAHSFTFESPHGLDMEEWPEKTHDRILDVQLSLYEAMMQHELDKKDRK